MPPRAVISHQVNPNYPGEQQKLKRREHYAVIKQREATNIPPEGIYAYVIRHAISCGTHGGGFFLCKVLRMRSTVKFSSNENVLKVFSGACGRHVIREARTLAMVGVCAVMCGILTRIMRTKKVVQRNVCPVNDRIYPDSHNRRLRKTPIREIFQRRPRGE